MSMEKELEAFEARESEDLFVQVNVRVPWRQSFTSLERNIK